MSISWLNSCETSHFLVDGKYPRGLQRNKYKGAFLQANPHLTLNLVISWRNSCGKNMLLEYRFIPRKCNMAAVCSQSQGRDKPVRPSYPNTACCETPGGQVWHIN